MNTPIRLLLAAAVALVTTAGQAQASVIITVNEYSSSTIDLTFSGTFDQTNAASDQVNWFAIHPGDSPKGTHSDWWTGLPSVVTSTLVIDGASFGAGSWFLQDGDGVNQWQDSVFVSAGLIEVGDAISGQVVISATGIDTSRPIGAYIGFDDAAVDWDIRVASLVVSAPEPAALALLGLGLAGMGFSKRKKA